jgi:16S rRNA G966 N2-methylase RsmD
MTDFPWRKYTKKELLDEFMKLKMKLNESSVFFPITYSRLGLKCSNNFFQFERLKTPSQKKISCYEFWKQKRSKVLEYYNSTSNNSSNDLYSTISFMNHAPSQFPIFGAGQIYKHFNSKKILDPYAGWGDRCLAAMALDIDYIGIDSNTRLKPLYDKMIKYFPTKSKIEIIYEKCENVDLKHIEYDLIFSSPPFWDKTSSILLEKYYKSEEDYETFINDSVIKLIKNSLKYNPKVWVCLNMPKTMYDDIKNKIGSCKKVVKFKSGLTKNSKNHSNSKLSNIYCF